RCPESEAVVERTGEIVLEFLSPCRATIDGLVDTKVGRIISDGLKIGDFVADALHVAELKEFGAVDLAGFPGLSAVGSKKECAVTSRGPDDVRVHRADRNQAFGGAAVLRSEFGETSLCGCGKRAQH